MSERIRKAGKIKRIRKDVNLDPEIIKWVNDKIKQGVYWNFSHCIECLIKEKIKKNKRETESIELKELPDYIEEKE